jgi:hypothetical protein
VICARSVVENTSRHRAEDPVRSVSYELWHRS